MCVCVCVRVFACACLEKLEFYLLQRNLVIVTVAPSDDTHKVCERENVYMCVCVCVCVSVCACIREQGI